MELGIVIFFLLLVFAGIAEFGRVFWYYDALDKATRDGARTLSLAERADFASGSHIDDAKSIVVAAANAANIRPALTDGNVAVTCLDGSFNTVTCADGSNAPANVRVAITGYTVDIGAMVPFISSGGSTTYAGKLLSPQTTMRYMN